MLKYVEKYFGSPSSILWLWFLKNYSFSRVFNFCSLHNFAFSIQIYNKRYPKSFLSVITVNSLSALHHIAHLTISEAQRPHPNDCNVRIDQYCVGTWLSVICMGHMIRYGGGWWQSWAAMRLDCDGCDANVITLPSQVLVQSSSSGPSWIAYSGGRFRNREPWYDPLWQGQFS